MTLNLLTTKEACLIIAKRTGRPMSARQLRHEIKLGRLKAEKIANTYFIDPEDLNRYERGHPGHPFKKNQTQKD